MPPSALYVCAWCVFVVTVLLGLVWLLSLPFFILFWRCNFLSTSSVSI